MCSSCIRSARRAPSAFADQVGSLKPGKYAELPDRRPGESRYGPIYDLYGALVFAASFPNISQIYVGGELVAEHGKLVKHDTVELGRDVRAHGKEPRDHCTHARRSELALIHTLIHKVTRMLRSMLLSNPSMSHRARAVVCAAAILFCSWVGAAAEPPRLLVKNALIMTMAPTATRMPSRAIWLSIATGRLQRSAAVRLQMHWARQRRSTRRACSSSRDSYRATVISRLQCAEVACRTRELDGLIDNPLPFFSGRFYEKGDLYSFALHGSLDYLRNGITSAFEYPIRSREMTDEKLYKEMLQAELASGMRIVYGYNVPDLALEQARAAFVDFKAFAEREAARNPRLLKLALAKTGHLGRWGKDFFPNEVAIAKEFDLDLQLHFLESNFYQRQNRADFKMMEEVGALDVGLIYGHFIHYSEDILNKSVAAGARMVWNPLSNGRIASGLADVPKYLKAGMTVGMGLDGQSTADLADPFENMRMGLYSQRMKYNNASILLPQDMLRLHTLGTAQAIGVADKVGSLEVGKFADFLLVDTTQPDTGPVYDPYATLVFVCSSSNVDTVFVGGEPVVRRGQPLKFDAQAVAADAKARVAAIQRRSEKAASVASR